MKRMNYVGLDVHKKTIVAYHVDPKGKGSGRRYENTARGHAQMLQWLKLMKGGIEVCYEAGPCGYFLYRLLTAAKLSCHVIAPTLIPRKPGEKVKTDRRDAKRLAELLLKDELTDVIPPSPVEENARALVRLRHRAKKDQSRARHQVAGYLLRSGKVYDPEKRPWTQAYRRWLESLNFEDADAQAVFELLLEEVRHQDDRLSKLDQKVQDLSQRPEHKSSVDALKCFRGIETTSAMILQTELYHAARFVNAPGLMKYIGGVPREETSGEKERRGKITKTGNTHVRRVLVELSGMHRPSPHVGADLKRRRKGQPPWVIDIADKAMKRLHKKSMRMLFKGKHTNVVKVAVAREWLGFIWAVMSRVSREQNSEDCKRVVQQVA